MKTKIYYSLFFAITFLFLFQTCKPHDPCSKDPGGYFNIPNTERVLIPYKSLDTINLQYNGGPLTSFMDQNKDSGYILNFHVGQECPSNLQNLQFLRTNYISTNYTLPLIIKQSLNYNEYGQVPELSTIKITFNNTEFSCYNDLRGNYYLDSIVINGKTYRNIILMHTTTNCGSTDVIYYNVQNGILKIISQGKEWTIVE